MKNKNLFYWLSIYFLIFAIIISGIVILVGYNYFLGLLLDSYRYRLQYDVQEVIGNVQNSMDEAVRFTDNLEMDYKQGHVIKNPRQYLEIVFKVQDNMPAFGIETSEVNDRSHLKSGFILNRSGVILKSDTGRFNSKNTKINDWITQMRYTSKSEWSPPFYDPEIGSRLITYARSFDYNKDKISLHATVFCSVALDKNLGNLSHQKMMKSGFTVLFNEQNRIIYHPDSSKTGQDVSSLFKYFEGSRFDISKLLSDRLPGYQLVSPKSRLNKRAIAIYWPVRTSKWFIITVLPERLFMSELKRITFSLILLILFIGSVTAAVTIYDSIKMISPISFLADNSRKILEEVGIDTDISLNDPKKISDKESASRISKTYPVSHLNDIEVLSYNMEKIKDRLASYRENTLQSSLDKEAMDKELNLARDIEMGMIPTNFPLFPGRNDIDCFGRLIPAKIVGGDLFDIFILNDNQLFISISDTLGKGIPAAMYSVMIRTFIRSITNPVTRIGKMMELLNDTLSTMRESDMFATVLLGMLDLETGEFIYCNAGHPHPIILRNNNREEVLTQSHGIPVGVKSNIQYSESRTILASGESLITFSDGVTEQGNDNGEFFGVERLISVVNPLREFTTQDIVNKTLGILEQFRGTTEVHDDITLVALKFLGK